MPFFRRFLSRSLFFDSDGGGGGGTDPSSGDGDNPTAPGGRLDPERLKAKHGDAEAALRSLAYKLDEVERDNAQLRQERRELREQVPGEDDVVLSEEDAQALRERGLITDEGAVDVAPYDEATERAKKADRLEREKHMETVAEVAGAKLGALKMVGADLEYEVQGEGENRSVRVREGEEDDWTPLAKYADEHWADVKDSIFPEDGGASASESGGEGDQKTKISRRPGGGGSSAPDTQAGEGSRPAAKDKGEGGGGQKKQYRFQQSSDVSWD